MVHVLRLTKQGRRTKTAGISQVSGSVHTGDSRLPEPQ